MTQSPPFFLTLNSFIQLTAYIVVLGLLIRPLGKYIADIFKQNPTFISSLFGPLEKFCYRFIRINPQLEMSWKTYTLSLLIFNFTGFLVLFCILMCQGILPLNPQHFHHLSPDLAFNIAVSFMTNTNWQSYSGENTLSHFSQMIGLTVQNFLSAGTGLCVFVAFIRGFSRRSSITIGNFWVDLTRGTLYILLPLSFIVAIILGSQGVVQTFQHSRAITPYESSHTESSQIQQIIPLGPVASQVAIKQLGSNGGGYYNANSAHPFENPTPFSNFIELIAILLIPMSLCYTFGILVRDRQQGWAVFKAMTLLFIPFSILSIYYEQQGNQTIQEQLIQNHIIQEQLHTPEQYQGGGNMEGKEIRFGILNSALWSAATTATSNGSTNASLDSYTPLGGSIPLFFIQLSEIVYGGVGTGLTGMLIFVILTVFMAGLMVGRTPEYLGKKIQPFEMQMASLVILIPPCTALVLTAIAVSTSAGTSGILNPKSHGFTEILYAFSSAANSNGSAFSGLNSNTLFYNLMLSVAMLLGRFGTIIPILAIAGSCAAKKRIPTTEGTLSTTSLLFISFLIGMIFIVGLLAYLTPFILGPVIEYLSS